MSAPLSFADWTLGRDVPSLGTNDGATPLPFQRWVRFKEAFAPEIVARAVRESGGPVATCIDPFAGSGTTALACQFLGVRPIAIEVNPYLADLNEAKLHTYDLDRLAEDYGRVLRRANSLRDSASEGPWEFLPPTFVEPGRGDRWIFDRPVAERIAALLRSITEVEEPSHERFFRVLLGGILVNHSNVVVSGKGRRYRRRWQTRQRSADSVFAAFAATTQDAIGDLRRFRNRRCLDFDLRRGDARQVLPGIKQADLAVFSPPYPNSFDYTDVYNVELWVLGYLSSMTGNRDLRLSTVSSHVQILRDYQPAPAGSDVLNRTLERMAAAHTLLWSRWLPNMVGAYFADLAAVLRELHRILPPGASAWIVVGDSQYAGILIEAGAILAELAPTSGFTVRLVEPFRSMRGSPQQGQARPLSETLLVLDRTLPS